MSRIQKKKTVFISSTYKDLEPTRQKVSKTFHDLEYSVVRMEVFPSDAMEPDSLSCKKLDECDIFVLILGHKYGTIPQDLDISITHNEYRRAVNMLRKSELENIFVFIATDDFKIRNSDIEEDYKRKKLREFKNEIKQTFRYFSDEIGLIEAIHQTLHNTLNKTEKKSNITTFKSLSEVSNLIDRNITQSKKDKINEALNEFMNFLSPIFKINDEDIFIDQPIINKFISILDKYIPNVVFEENPDFKGRIERWEIRHVVFRAETAIKLMQYIDPTDKTKELKKLGQEIGQNASKDLFQKLINPKTAKQPLVPKKFGAFIELLNYWDSSGGWGELKHIDDEDELNRAGIKKQKNIEILRTENNFLADTHSLNGKNEIDDIDHLYKFWEGYIHGIFNVALRELETIYASLEKEMREEIEINQYIKVLDVRREAEDIKDKDFFSVIFEEHKYGEEIETLASIRDEIEKGSNTLNKHMASLKFVIKELEHKDKYRFTETIKSFNQDDQNAITEIINHNSDKTQITKVELMQFEKVVNLFLQDFIHNK